MANTILDDNNNSDNDNTNVNNDNISNASDNLIENNYDSQSSDINDQYVYDRSYLIINYIPQDVNEEELKSYFTQCGEILSFRIAKDKTTGECLSYGFVKYINESSAYLAIQSLNGKEILNKKLKVSYAKPSWDISKNSKLYITNLPEDFTQRDLIRAFRRYGEIIESRLLERTNERVGVAFIIFKNYNDALNACSLHGKYLPGCIKKLQVKFADQNRRKSHSSSEHESDLNQSVHGNNESFDNEDYYQSKSSDSSHTASASQSPYNNPHLIGYPNIMPISPNYTTVHPIQPLDTPIAYNGSYTPTVMTSSGYITPYTSGFSTPVNYNTAYTGVPYYPQPYFSMQPSTLVTVFIDELCNQQEVNAISALCNQIVHVISISTDYNSNPNQKKFFKQLFFRCKVLVNSSNDAIYLINNLHYFATNYPFIRNTKIYYA